MLSTLDLTKEPLRTCEPTRHIERRRETRREEEKREGGLDNKDLKI
jgi:hypothetical protein